MDEIGNQQATQTQLAWLAGVMDGEGAFMIVKCQRGKKWYYYPRITLTNSDPTIINEADKIVRALGVTPHLYEDPRLNHNQKNTIMLHVDQRLAPCLSFTKAILPYLIGKRARAELLMRFCESRIREGKEFPEMVPLYEQMKAANRFGKANNVRESSEAMSSAPA